MNEVSFDASAAETITLSVEEDFVAKQTTKSDPILALSELIWNSLDADALQIDIEFEKDDLANGLSKIIVVDNGSGFSREEARVLFKNLGGSWKRTRRQTKLEKRIVHGQEGKGRYKAFSLGSSIEWKVCYAKDDGNYYFTITVLESNLKNIMISGETLTPEIKTGVTVVIADIKRNFEVLSSDTGFQDISEIFAPYLINYKNIRISLSGQIIDPKIAIKKKKTFELDAVVLPDGETHTVTLDIIEWNRETKRSLYLCTEQGFPLLQKASRFNVGAYPFSAYILSTYITKLGNENALGLAGMGKELQTVIDVAREQIKQHFRERAAAEAKNVVEEWKKEEIYPFKGEPTSPIEQAERQVFDIIAVSVKGYTPDFEVATKRSKALHLRMLKTAIEKSPSELQLILNEVLELPKNKQKEFAELLQETSLAGVIAAAKIVSDRLKFIIALESIVFDPEMKKKLKERTQLHKILQENTWVFGEQYNLWVSDKSLTTVLRSHKKKLDPDIVIDEPVKIIGKKQGIVDLMFSTAVHRHQADDIEHLVVELKAPSVKIGNKAISQTEDYAFAVIDDERFNTIPGLRWHYWVISNEMDNYAKQKIQGGPDRRRNLVHETERLTIGIRTWAEIIQENKARLQFFQEHLQYNAEESDALKYLQQRHHQFLKGVLVDTGEK